jgi:hypothetical protein
MSRKRSIGTNLTDTTKVTAYTVPTGITADWTLLYIVNTGSNNTISVYWYDASTSTEFYVLGAKNLNTGDYVLFNGAEVILQAGDQIRYQLGSSGAMTAIATVEITSPIGVNGGA